MKRGRKPQINPEDIPILVRWYWQGFVLREIAEALGLTEPAIYGHLRPYIAMRPGKIPLFSKVEANHRRICQVRESRRRWRFKMETKGGCPECGQVDGHKAWCKRGVKGIKGIK